MSDEELKSICDAPQQILKSELNLHEDVARECINIAMAEVLKRKDYFQAVNLVVCM